MSSEVESDMARRCIMCCEDKAESEFYRYAYTQTNGTRGHRFDSRCKPCARTRRRADYRNNTEARKRTARAYKAAQGEALIQKVRDYRSANREKWLTQKRAYELRRRAGANLDSAAAVALVRLVLDEARVGQRYMDAYTGDLIDDPEVDHIVPISKGGAHVYENLCVTSGTNNRRKKDAPLLLWLIRRKAA